MDRTPFLRRYAIAGFVAFTLVVTGVFVRQGWITEVSREQLRHTYEVRERIQHVYLRVKELEVGQRGFILSGDEAYLEPYHEALAGIPLGHGVDDSDTVALWDELSRLRALTADNPRQARLGDSLKALVHRRAALAAHLIGLRRAEGLDVAVAEARKGEGQRLMDSTRGVVGAMLAEEDRLLRHRSAVEARAMRTNSIILYSVVGLFYAALAWSLFAAAGSRRRRVRAERELERSHKLQEAVIHSGSHAIFSTDNDGTVILFNLAAERMFGFRADEVIGRKAKDVLHGIHDRAQIERRRARLEARLGRPVRGLDVFMIEPGAGEAPDPEWTLYRRDGETFLGSMVVSELADMDGRVYGHMCAIRDITARRMMERRLAESNAMLKALVDSSPFGILAADANGSIIVFNKAAERILGMSAAGFLGRPAEELMRCMIAADEIERRTGRVAEDMGRPPQGIEVFTHRLPEDPASGLELDLLRHDGSRFPGIMAVSLIRGDAEKRPLGAVALVNDLSEQRRLEDSLRRSNTLFNAVITSTDQAIIAVDLEGTLILYNPAAERMEGYAASEFLGKHTSYNTRKTMLFKEIEERAERLRVHYGREPEDVEVFTLPLPGDPPGGVEWTFVRNGGGRYPVSMAVSEMKDSRGTLMGYMAVIRDITATKALEARLRESSARLQAVLDGIDYAIFAADREGTLQMINRGAERILGYPVSDMVGRPVSDLAARFADPDELRARASRLAKHYGRLVNEMELISLPLPDDGPFGQEWTHARPDGSRITLAFSVYTLRDDDGRPDGVVALARDITQLKALDRMKNEFISTVSHELRTPLTSIRGALGLVAGGAAGALPEKAGELVSIAYRNSERLVHIINDILDIEKIESGRLTLQVHPLDTAEQLRQAVESHQAYADKYGVRIVLKEVPENVLVLADPERLMQVLANLLSNAAKFSPKGGEIWVSAVPYGDGLRISVRDFGDGIPESFRSRIFEKFAQADGNDARRRDGTGLGLSITKKLVETMQGRIGFTTGTGQGTTFNVDLPVGGVPAAGPLQGDRSGGADERPRVLVCEDDVDVGSLLRILLEREGIATDVVGTLEEARAFLKAAGARPYAALTLDLMLPDGSGLALLRELRRAPATQDLPVIVISARAEDGRRELNGDAIGMVDWMMKPIDEQRLTAALRRALGGSERPRILHIEDDADFREVLARSLREAADWVGAPTLKDAEAHLAAGRFDLVVLDLDLPDGSGLSLLEHLKSLPTGPVPVLILSASEMDNGIRKKVEAALVKSRLSEERIVQTILAQIRKVSRTEGGTPT